MRKRLSVSEVKVRAQPVNMARVKNERNKKIMTQRRAKQLEGWRVKKGLERTSKHKKLRRQSSNDVLGNSEGSMVRRV